jgi:hypothetical protein
VSLFLLEVTDSGHGDSMMKQNLFSTKVARSLVLASIASITMAFTQQASAEFYTPCKTFFSGYYSTLQACNYRKFWARDELKIPTTQCIAYAINPFNPSTFLGYGFSYYIVTPDGSRCAY